MSRPKSPKPDPAARRSRVMGAAAQPQDARQVEEPETAPKAETAATAMLESHQRYRSFQLRTMAQDALRAAVAAGRAFDKAVDLPRCFSVSVTNHAADGQPGDADTVELRYSERTLSPL